MSFLKKLFGGKKRVQCPRCLGKGFVNDEDIKRLKMQLFWTAGPCAYCEAKGVVTPDMIERVPADLAYLTTDISTEERDLVIANDTIAQQRALAFNKSVGTLVHQIIYLHFTCALDPEKIADFFLLGEAATLHESGTYQDAKNDLIRYANKVIASKSNSDLN